MISLKRTALIKTWFRLTCLLALVVFVSCQPDREYRQLIEQVSQNGILSAMEQTMQPNFAVISPEILDSALHHSRTYQDVLSRLDLQNLSRDQRTQLDSLQRNLRANINRWEQYRSDPSLYSISAEVKKQLTRQDLSLEERLRIIGRRMDVAEEYYRAAKINIRSPLPERSQLAAHKQILGLRLLSEELPDSIRQAALPHADSRELLQKVKRTTLYVKDYLAFCESLWFEHLDSLVRRNGDVLSIRKTANPQ